MADNWVHPDSTYDDGNDWADDDSAIDGNTETGAYTFDVDEPIELRLDTSMSCDKIRIFCCDFDDPANHDLDVKIEVYYSGGWHTIKDGTVAHDEYVTVEIGSTQTVSKAQVTANVISGISAVLWEFDFNETEEPVEANAIFFGANF